MGKVEILIDEILHKGKLVSLGTIDEKGVWVSDLIYVHDSKMHLYWLSYENSRHAQAIEKNPHVSCAITLEQFNVGLQMEGIVKKLSGDNLERAIALRIKRATKPVPKEEGEILSKGQFWYEFIPTTIDLIHEPLFGFEKKVVQMKNQ